MTSAHPMRYSYLKNLFSALTRQVSVAYITGHYDPVANHSKGIVQKIQLLQIENAMKFIHVRLPLQD